MQITQSASQKKQIVQNVKFERDVRGETLTSNLTRSRPLPSTPNTSCTSLPITAGWQSPNTSSRSVSTSTAPGSTPGLRSLSPHAVSVIVCTRTFGRRAPMCALSSGASSSSLCTIVNSRMSEKKTRTSSIVGFVLNNEGACQEGYLGGCAELAGSPHIGGGAYSSLSFSSTRLECDSGGVYVPSWTRGKVTQRKLSSCRFGKVDSGDSTRSRRCSLVNS